MFVYAISPIDFGWEHCPTVSEFAGQIARLEFDNIGYGSRGDFDEFVKNFEKAKELALAKGWEGDIRGEAHVFQVPVEGAFAYGFAWKQDNNGDTFVISPVELPHLKSLEF